MDDTAITIPPTFLAFADRSEAWAAWMEALPRLIREVLAEWQLVVDGPVTHGEVALVIPVTTPERDKVVVKLGFPHWEADHEHVALGAWAGRGVVRLLRADPHRCVLMLERAHRRDLTTVPVLEACQVVAAAYSKLHIPASPKLRSLADLVGQWDERLTRLPTHRLAPRRYVEQAASLARDFASDPATDGRLIHTDLHYLNVLAAEREPWLVIDPKPLSGDPHYEIAPLLWNRWDEIESAYSVRAAIRERFHAAVDVAVLDEERARSWVIVREMVNVLWTFEDVQRRGGTPADIDQDDNDWISRCVTITKAVQD